MMKTNEELDTAVLDAIRSGMTRASAVQEKLKMPGNVVSRAIDRSLQRLRRRGFIEYGKLGSPFAGWRAKS